jgi:hypothetical protein
MLPDPKKVAKTLTKLFQSQAEKQQEAERGRDVQIRMGKTRLQRHLTKQKRMAARLKELAKRALALNAEARFQQVGRQLLWTQGDIRRWEQYLLSLEILEARRDQVKASTELITAIQAMSASLQALDGPQQVGELQHEIEAGLAKAGNIEDRLGLMMDMLDETLGAGTLVDETDLTNLETVLTDEVAAQEAAAFDPEIEAGLRKIRTELQKEGR